jgi:hypothetical protein
MTWTGWWFEDVFTDEARLVWRARNRLEAFLTLDEYRGTEYYQRRWAK